VLHEPKYRRASERIATEIASAPGFPGLATVVDRLVASHGNVCRPSTSLNGMTYPGSVVVFNHFP
jgi:hypothetical protein